MTVSIWQVGGSVRDEFLGRASKDIDFTATADSWTDLINWLDQKGFKRFLTNPEYFTVRAHFPQGFQFAGKDMSDTTADFVLARKESKYTDGRRPDAVSMGTLHDDLARRDLTINSIAKDQFGQYLDYYDGEQDIKDRLIRAVGDPKERFKEDALRVLRALRFCVTLNFRLHLDVHNALFEPWLHDLVAQVAVDRRRDELTKMFKVNPVFSMQLLTSYPLALQNSIFADNLWLQPTLRAR